MKGTPNTTVAGSEWKKRGMYVLVIAALIIAILLLRTCRKIQPPAQLPFNYFRAKASELKFDTAAITAFARDGVKTLPYRGDVKGPLATLWNGAGSPEEKKALADALLAYAQPVKTATLDDVAPMRDKAGDSSASAAAFTLKIIHRAIRATDPDESAPVDTVVYDGPVGALVGDVHTIETIAPLRTRLTLRGEKAVTRDITCPDDAAAEQIVFSYRKPALLKPGSAADIVSAEASPAVIEPVPPIIVTRELWHAGNAVGANHAEVGDRHDFVVIPGRIGKFVREKEELILKEHHREAAPEARAYLMLLDYGVRSDRMLSSLEAHRKVTALFDQPRILFVSQFITPTLPGGVAWALDLRANDTTFDGPMAASYLATQARSFMEAGLEQKFLSQRSGLPSTSTFDVFTRLKEDYPNTCARRLALIRETLTELRAFSAINATATFSIHRQPAPRGAKAVTVSSAQAIVSRRQNGQMHLKSSAVKEGFIQRLNAQKDAVKIPAGKGIIDADFVSDDDLAVSVETALLAADEKPGVSPDYVLSVSLDRGSEPLVEPGAQFLFSWGQGESRTDQKIVIADCGDDLSFRWRVQTSALPIAGERTISEAVLATSTIHNPWYRAGMNYEKEATSFCISRKAFESIKAGKSIELSLQARHGAKDEDHAKRPIDFRAPLTPVGQGEHEVSVNGQKVMLPVIRCKLKDSEFAILDDPSYPIGMADKLTVINTSVRGRLVDETGVPIRGARIEVTGKSDDGENADFTPVEATTAADGSFRLRPPPDLKGKRSSYGNAAVKVRMENSDLVETSIDLTAPGLTPVEIKIARPRAGLVYLTKSNATDLDPLPLTDQVKRNARRDLAAGKLVVIPNRMASDGLHKLVGYFACDRASGYTVGVTEDGLNGSNQWQQATITAAKSIFKARKDMLDEKNAASAAFHMYRGAVVSWWVYGGDRLAGDSHKQAIIDTLAAMEGWSSALNLSTYAERAAHDALGDSAAADKLASELTGKFTELVNSGIAQAEGDTANAAFEIGYISGTVGLAHLIGDDDSD
jgi:hypothetical protein